MQSVAFVCGRIRFNSQFLQFLNRTSVYCREKQYSFEIYCSYPNMFGISLKHSLSILEIRIQMNNRVQMTFDTHWVRKKYFSENLSKKKKRNVPRWARNHVLQSGISVLYQLHHVLLLFYSIWFKLSKLILAVKMMKI